MKPPSPCTGSSTAQATEPGSTSPLKSFFNAAVQQHRLLLGSAVWAQFRQPAADFHVRLVHPHHEALVEVPVDLRMQRVDDSGEIVAEIRAPEPAGEVNVLAAVGVPDSCA